MCGDRNFRINSKHRRIKLGGDSLKLYALVFLVTFFSSSVLNAHGKIELQLESTRWQNPTGTVVDLAVQIVPDVQTVLIVQI
jgi:hypothetical protein